MSTERANDRVITVHAPFLVLAIARNQKSLGNMAINCVGRKFGNILLTSLKESLALFPVNELKAEQRLITEKIVASTMFSGNCRQVTVKVFLSTVTLRIF